MKEPRRTWRKIIGSRHLAAGSPEETAFIEENFRGLATDTFRIDLSRGFSSELSPQLAKVCASAGIPYEPENWIRPSRRKGLGSPDLIRYFGSRITDSASLYASLEKLYRASARYECVRVGGLFSRNRDSLILQDGILQPNPDSKRLPYVKVFWERLRNKALVGSAVHVVRTVDRLVELWACAELLRELGQQESNRLYLAPVVAPPGPPDTPVMGVRVINDRWTLMSIPPLKPYESRYSSWID